MSVFVHLNKRIQRGVDDSARHLFALQKSLLGPFPFGNVARNLRRAHDSSRRRTKRRNTQRDDDSSAIFGHTHGLVMVNSFSARYSSQFARHFLLAIVGNDDSDAGTDGVPRGVPQQLLGSSIPTGNGAMQIYREDGVVRRLHRCQEEPPSFRRLTIRPNIHQLRLSLMTMRTRSAMFFAPSFPMMCAR